jgi:hypothetical protein
MWIYANKQHSKPASNIKKGSRVTVIRPRYDPHGFPFRSLFLSVVRDHLISGSQAGTASPHRILFLNLAIAPAANSKPFSVYPTVLQLPIPSAMPSAAALSSLTSHRSCEKIPGPILKLQWWRRSSRSGLEANSRASAPFLETSLYSSGSYCQMADGKAIRRRRATAWPWIYNAIDCLPGPKL